MLTPEQAMQDIGALPNGYKTQDVDRLIGSYVRQKADVSLLRPYVNTGMELYRIYYFVSLKQIKDAGERLRFIHENLLFSDWWHTDQLIGFVADVDFDTAMRYASEYVVSENPYIRRWGYVLFISRLGRGHAQALLPLMKNDAAYTVQMAQAWLAAELAVQEPEQVYNWFIHNGLDYSINGKAIQKICDSFRISEEWKQKCRSLRPQLR